MKRNLSIILILIFTLLLFAGCTNRLGAELKINVPDEILEAELGSYDLPKFEVVDKENLIQPGYEVIVKKVLDPNGNNVVVAYNQINAIVPGTYTIIYGVSDGKVKDAELKVDFADRTAPILDMKDDALPKYFIQGMTYNMPAYQLTGNPDYDSSWAKMYYLTDKGAEPVEVSVVNNMFTVEHNTGIYQLVIHAEDAAGNVKEYKFNVEATGPSETIDGKILYFDEKFGVSQVKTLWNDFELSYSTEKAWENEAGSMKVVVNGTNDYIILDKLVQSDVSEYTHLVLRIFNANEHDVMTGFCWMGDTRLKAGEWTEFKIPVEWLDTKNVLHPQSAGIKIDSSNIANLAIRLWDDYENNTVKTGSVFYFSAMYAIVGAVGPEEVADDKIVYFDEKFGLEQVSLFWPDAQSLTFDETVKFGDDKGSLKITYNHAQGWNYLIIDNPYLKDVSEYDYIKFNVYNPTTHEFTIQFTWAGETKIKPNAWTEVKIPVSNFMDNKIVDMSDNKLSATNISSLPIYFDGADFVTDECFYISAIYAGNEELGELGYLPEYDGTFSIVDCGDETHMIHITGATAESFEDYCSKVVAKGFTLVSERSVANNLFATFSNESKYVYAYYTDYNKEMRVMTGAVESLIPEDCSTNTNNGVTPYIASIPQPAQGEGYIVRLPDGRFIIQDGGYEGDDRVYTTLRELVGDEDIVIAAWFISHPHADHYPAFIDFIKNHSSDSDVTVERVIHNYGHIDMLTSNVTDGDPVPVADILEFYETLETYAPDIPVFKAHTGQLISFGSATVEILYTMEDIVPTAITNPNDSSMVIRIEIGEDSVIFLNDTGYASGPILHNIWGSYLKTDIVQIAHHGMWPSVESIYHDIAGEVILVPNLNRYFKNYIADSRWVDVINAALSYAKDFYVSGDKLMVHELPYVIQNNKEEMYDYVINYTGREDYKGFDEYDMTDGDIAPFDKFVGGYTSISASHGTAEYTTEYKFGDEAGSLKLTVAKTSEVYLTITLPYTTDISEYDYIVFRVYNPTDTDIKAGICWAGDTVCKAGEWTEVRIPISNFELGKIDALTGKDIPITNICGLVIRFISGFEANDVFYISAVRAEKEVVEEPEEVADNVAVKFDKDTDLSHVSVYWPTVNSISIDTTVRHGEDAGSLKVVANNTNYNYITLKTPYNTDFSEYDYITFWIYNAGSAAMMVGTNWCGGVSCAVGEWTQVTITKELFEANKVKNMSETAISMSDITGFVLRINYNATLSVGDIFYISSVTGGKNEVVEEEVPENIAVKFENETDLNHISVYWSSAHSVNIDTTVKYGDEAGSLKVVAASTSFNYIILNAPCNSDFSAYDYISFWVYNPGSTDFKMGTTWAADTTCVAGQWTEIRITKEMFESSKVKDMNGNVITMADITNLPLRLISNLAVGDTFYISSVVAGKND